MKFPTILFCLLSALGNHATAIPVRVLAWDGEIAARKLSISGAKGVSEIKDMHPFSRTKTIQVTAGETPPMLLAIDKPDEKGNPAASKIIIAAGMKSPLLILLPDEKSATGIRPLVIEDDISGFRWGTIRFINATGKELVFKWDKKFAAIPATWKPTDVSPGGSTRSMGVELFLKEKPDRPLYSAVWEHREEFRKLIFIVPSEDSRLGSVAFKTISEDRRVIAADKADRLDRPSGEPR